MFTKTFGKNWTEIVETAMVQTLLYLKQNKKTQKIWLSEWSQSRSNQKPTSIWAELSLISIFQDDGTSLVTFTLRLVLLDIDIAAHF